MSPPLSLPLPQSEEFAKTALVLGRPLRQFKRGTGGALQLWWQVQSRHLGRFGRVDFVSRGPVAATPDDMDEWLDGWRHWHGAEPLLLNADGTPPNALRKAGFFPLMTPASLALFPLGDEATMRRQMAQKWRNRLNRAENMGLTLCERNLTEEHWLLQAEAEQARRRRYRGMPPALSLAFAAANPGKARVFEARQKGKPIAGALMLCHGRMATWQIGVTTHEGRKSHAMNLLLWHAMQSLADRGHDCLDLGVLNKQDAPGMTHFKLGTGARIHRLGGTWLHHGVLAPIARLMPGRLAA